MHITQWLYSHYVEVFVSQHVTPTSRYIRAIIIIGLVLFITIYLSEPISQQEHNQKTHSSISLQTARMKENSFQ